MSKSTKYYAKIFGILFILIASLMALFLWMNNSINQNQVEILYAQTDIPAGTNLTTDQGTYLRRKNVHVDSLPEGYFENQQALPENRVTIFIPEGSQILNGHFVDPKPEDEVVDDSNEKERTDIAITVAPSQVSGNLIEQGDEVVIFGSMPTSQGMWIGVLADKAIATNVSGSFSEGSVSVTFSVESDNLSQLERAIQSGKLNFLVNTNPPSQTNLYEEDIFRNLASLVGRFSNPEDATIRFTENRSLLRNILDKGESETLFYSFDDFTTPDGEEGAYFRWEGISPKEVLVQHYSLSDGEIGRYHGRYTLESSVDSRKIFYDSQRGIFSLGPMDKATFKEEGLYVIELKYEETYVENEETIIEEKSKIFRFVLEEEKVLWETFVGYEKEDGTIQQLQGNFFHAIVDLDNSEEVASYQQQRGEIYLTKNYFKNLKDHEDFKPILLNQTTYGSRVRKIEINMILLGSDYSSFKLFEHNRANLFEKPFAPQPRTVTLENIASQLEHGQGIEDVLTQNQIENFVQYLNVHWTDAEIDYLYDFIGYINSNDYGNDMSPLIQTGAEQGTLLALMKYLSVFDDRVDFELNPTQQYIYYNFINTQDHQDRGITITVTFENVNGDIFETTVAENYQTAGGE